MTAIGSMEIARMELVDKLCVAYVENLKSIGGQPRINEYTRQELSTDYNLLEDVEGDYSKSLRSFVLNELIRNADIIRIPRLRRACAKKIERDCSNKLIYIEPCWYQGKKLVLMDAEAVADNYIIALIAQDADQQFITVNDPQEMTQFIATVDKAADINITDDYHKSLLTIVGAENARYEISTLHCLPPSLRMACKSLVGYLLSPVNRNGVLNVATRNQTSN